MHGCRWNFVVMSWSFSWELLQAENALIWASAPTPAVHRRFRQSLTSKRRNPLIFSLSGLMLIVGYSAHHVKYKIIVTFHIQILMVQLTLHSCFSSDLVSRILLLSRIHPGRSTPSQVLAPSILLLPGPLPKLLSVCQKIVENCQPRMVTLLSSLWCVYVF